MTALNFCQAESIPHVQGLTRGRIAESLRLV